MKTSRDPKLLPVVPSVAWTGCCWLTNEFCRVERVPRQCHPHHQDQHRHHYFIISSSSKKKSPSLAAENKLFDALIQSGILSLGIFHRWDTTSWMAHPCVLITIYEFSALRQLHQKEDDRKFKVEKLENQLKYLKQNLGFKGGFSCRRCSH